MRKVKFVFWIIVAAFIGVVVSQNLAFFLEARHRITLDVFFDSYQTPPLPLALLFLGCFLAGLLMAYIGGLVERYTARKQIRQLTGQLDEARKTLSARLGGINPQPLPQQRPDKPASGPGSAEAPPTAF